MSDEKQLEYLEEYKKAADEQVEESAREIGKLREWKEKALPFLKVQAAEQEMRLECYHGESVARKLALMTCERLKELIGEKESYKP